MWTRFALIVAVTACGGSSRSVPPAPPPVRPPPEPVAATPDAAVEHEHDGADDDDHAHDHDAGEVECEDGIRDPASFPPVLAANAPERAWDIAIRAHVLADDCEHQWSLELKRCLHDGTAAACATHLPADLSERLALIDKLAAAIADARKQPASLGCKQMVAAHYGDVRWNGRLDGFTARVRTQMIADSRKLMLAACTTEKWDEATRACFALGGGDVCVINSDPPIRRMWGYPADGSVRTVGVPACDTYAALVGKFAICEKMPLHARESLGRTTSALMANIAAKPSTQRAKHGPSCEASLGAIESALRRAGC